MSPTLSVRAQQELGCSCSRAEQSDARCLETASYRRERVGEELPSAGLCLRGRDHTDASPFSPHSLRIPGKIFHPPPNWILLSELLHPAQNYGKGAI